MCEWTGASCSAAETVVRAAPAGASVSPSGVETIARSLARSSPDAASFPLQAANPATASAAIAIDL